MVNHAPSHASHADRLVPAGALQLLILQPTPFCNIDCDYCYLPNRDSKERMSDEVLRAALERVFESGVGGTDVCVVWHAGEPLVVSPDYYRHAMDIIREKTPAGVTVRHSIQSNGMLLNDEWCELLKTYDVQIGISIDGPAPLHDARRKTRSGKGTFAAGLRGIQKLHEHGIEFHVITVLTSASIEYPDEMFEFYLDNGIHRVGFNVEEIEGGHAKSSLLAFDVDRRFRAFLRRFLDLVDEHKGVPWVRDVEATFEMIASGGNGARDQQNQPWSIVSVDVHGGISTFSPELIGIESKEYGDFTIGNVLTDSLEDAARSQRFRQLDTDICAGVAACRESCKYFNYCGGGAPANKFFENGSMNSTETLYCRLTKKALFDVCAEFVTARTAAARGAT